MNKTKQYINTEVLKYENVNKEFTRCHISVCSYNQKANRTKFTKDGIEKAVSTLDYAPVIGYWRGDDFYDHGQEMLINDFGEIERKSYTVPYGVVIKDTARWEYIQKQNGEYEEYLCVDVYLWNRYEDQINKVKENKCNQSMEITIDNGEYKEDYFEIHDFSFDALCILSEDVDPAFVQAKIRTIDTNFTKSEQFTSEYREMIDALTVYMEKGGVEQMSKTKKSTQEDENELQQDANIAIVNESVEEQKETPDEEQVVEPTGEEQEDTQEEAEAEAEAEEESTDEEFACGTKKKKKTMENEENFEEKYNSLNIEYATVKAEKADLEKQYNALMEEVLQLREYKLNKEKELRAEKESEIFSKFEEIAKDESFIDLKKNSANYSLEELEDRAYAIYGRINKTKEDKNANKNKKQSTVTIYNNVDSSDFEENKITNSISELINKYKNK